MSQENKVPKRMLHEDDIRDISPFLKIFRNFLLGRKLTPSHRLASQMASRSPPLPNIPHGPHHKLSNNYYYARDGRGKMKPPEVVYDATNKLDAGNMGSIGHGN